jgi:molybdopterin biosynthesis enzyme
MVAEVIGTHGSADIIAASAADGAAVIPAGVRELQEGALVDFRPWRAIP